MFDADKMRIGYLHHIKIFLESENNNVALFRTFVDEWFALCKKGHFLTRSGRAVWFNNPDPAKHRDALLKMNFVSQSAFEVIEGGKSESLVKDHAVPVKVLRAHLGKLNSFSIENIEKTLVGSYKLGVITKSEHSMLNSFGLGSSMPRDWDGVDLFARYYECGIRARSDSTV